MTQPKGSTAPQTAGTTVRLITAWGMPKQAYMNVTVSHVNSFSR